MAYITPIEVYKLLSSRRNSATTSSPFSDQLVQTFQEINNLAEYIFCIILCSDISMMFK